MGARQEPQLEGQWASWNDVCERQDDNTCVDDGAVIGNFADSAVFGGPIKGGFGCSLFV